MIVLHQSLKRSEDLVRSLKYFFQINCKTIDGVIEIFNNTKEQGFVLKIFETYNRDNDLAIWMYESLDELCVKIGYSTLSNIDKYNNWKEINKVNFKAYPIVKNIKKKIINDVFNNIEDYYGLKEKIDNSWELKM